MSTVLLSIKTDDATKRQLHGFSKELGLTTTAVVNMLVKQALRDRRIVLDTTGLQPTPYLKKIITKAEDDLAQGRNIVRTKNKAETLAHLDSLMSGGHES